MSDRRPNYLLFSDVHLGADLVQHVRPWTVARLKQIARVDRDLASMLDWYRIHRDPERPWCLVIAGDLVDFIGMSIAPRPDAPLETALNDEERRHGLGSSGDHARWKMQAVARRHPLVFDRLARFVEEGHSLVLVRGNHDIDFHWRAAREAFVAAVLERAEEKSGEPTRREELASRIEFHPWFYYVEGLLYVEHGHQLDAACNYPHLLAPISPADPTRLHWSLSDWLLRMVARPTPGLGCEGHDSRTALDYLRFAWSIGVLGAARLGHRYAGALLRALRAGREALTERARAVRDEHERAMARMADRTRIRLDHLRELASLWPRPVASRVVAVARNAFLDRIGLGLVALLALSACVVAAILGAPAGVWAPLAAGILTGYGAYHWWSGRQRTRDVDPAPTMRRAARRIAELLPTRFVVMGHTHQPAVERVAEGVTYVNLGNWGVDELDGEPGEAPRTHLVLRWIDGSHRAEFVRWDPERGPRRVHEID